MSIIDRIIKLYKKVVDNSFFELNKSARPGGIVFLGDSITDFYRINEFFHDSYIINRGIGGDTTDGVLKRMPESVYDLSPSKVFILIGTNDIGENKDEEHVIYNIAQIIQKIQDNCPDARIYLQSIYPVSKAKDKKIRKVIVKKRNNEIISRINVELEKLAQEKGIVYIDVYSHLVDDEGNLKLDYTVEGLHLTVNGYKVVSDILRPYVLEEVQ
ncbi:MAG: lysophospholipase [Clostridiaceae bacterium]|jgi:lysophospholipase L1-like esterase|nr:lysophospholipase [Clostridiaceae bacterium]